MPRILKPGEFDGILSIINDSATAYFGVIPGDCYHEPYMHPDELLKGMDTGVVFWGLDESGRLAGVMGIPLIRHAYVLGGLRGRGIGSRLIEHLKNLSETPCLVGTWKAAVWAITFYEKHGFTALDHDTSQGLLKMYWDIPERQAETSLVLADERWMKINILQ